MREKITLAAADGHRLDAWHSTPESCGKGGIVILHAIFGLTSHMGDVCEKFTADGIHAIAPALYDRIGPGIVHPYTRDGAGAGRLSYASLKRGQILADIKACADTLRPHGPVAVCGFCTGGTWAWVAAARLDFDAAVIFYGSQVTDHLGLTPECPTILHYGDDDPVVPVEDIARIRTAHPGLKMHIYPGGRHAFFNPEQESYDQAAATLTWERSLEFLGGTFTARAADP